MMDARKKFVGAARERNLHFPGHKETFRVSTVFVHISFVC